MRTTCGPPMASPINECDLWTCNFRGESAGTLMATTPPGVG